MANAPRGTSPSRADPRCGGQPYEAAKCAARPGSPDYAYYHQVAQRMRGTKQASGKNPTLAVERKLLCRCYHTLRELGDAALAPPTPEPQVA
jgi:transposase